MADTQPSKAAKEPKGKALHIGIAEKMLLTEHGGCQRACANLANAMVRRGHTVTIFAMASPPNKPVYPLDPRIALRPVHLGDDHASIHSLREMLRQSNLSVCIVLDAFEGHLLWSVALLGSGVPHVYSEESCPSLVERPWSKSGRLAAMSGADAIRLLLPEYAASLPSFLQQRICIIPNAAPDISNIATVERSSDLQYTLLSLGRICEVKQIHLLIEAFEYLAPNFQDWRLDIWGEQYGVTTLTPRISQSSAQCSIRILGHCSDPLSTMRNAHIFCIPSIEEGFPLTVVEAMSCGTPVVGFAACPGVNHVIQDGISGLLVPDMTAASLANSLAELMKNEKRRMILGQGALERAKSYTPECVFDQWETLLHKVAACKGHTRMDAFMEEPFASQARLSAAARREWLFRDFGEPWPGTLAYYQQKILRKIRLLFTRA